jgi:hypothetical protein
LPDWSTPPKEASISSVRAGVAGAIAPNTVGAQ